MLQSSEIRIASAQYERNLQQVCRSSGSNEEILETMVEPYTVINMDNSIHTAGMKEKVVQAAKDNQKLSDLPGYAPSMLSHADTLDEDLQLTLLHAAAWTGDMSTIEHLRHVAADVTVATAGGFTALHLAASRGYTEVLQYLLSWSNGNVSASSREGFTALHLATLGGHYECAEFLLRECPQNAHVNARDKVMGRSALHWASAHTSSRRIFDLLLGNPDVNICVKDRAGFTPLHFAAMNVRERTLTEEDKQKLLEKIKIPSLLEVNTDQLVKDFFQDDRKKQLLQDFQSSEFSDGSLEQMILCQTIVEDVPRLMVNTLLDKRPDQVNDKVGNVGWFLSRPEVQEFSSRPWRIFSGVRVVHPGPQELTAGQSSSSLPHVSKYVSGYTALHFAARQDNGELVSHLLRLSNIEANEPDMTYGMTPLHCSLLGGGALKAFRRLMSFEGVDVNPQLTQGENYTTELTQGENYSTEFQSSETPLHLGIRFCKPEYLLQMMIAFCDHPKLNPAIRNSVGHQPLHLAWERAASTSPGQESSKRRKSKRRKARFNLSKKNFDDLQSALAVLEGHPGNALVLNHQQNAMSAALVAATLIAGFTFQGALQPPKSPPEYMRRTAVQVLISLFWLSNTGSFCAAVYTVLVCLESFIKRAAQKYPRYIAHQQRLSTTTSSLRFAVMSGSCSYFFVYFFHVDLVSIVPMPVGESPIVLYSLAVVVCFIAVVAFFRFIKKIWPFLRE